MLDCNQKELAKILGLSDRRIRQLAEDGLFVRDAVTKKYNLPKCVQEYIRYKIEAETETTKSVDFELQRGEHEQVKKEIAKLRLRRIRGELHEAADVEAVISDMLVRFRGKILAIPPKLAPLLLGIVDPNQVVTILKTELREALSELSDYDPANFADDRKAVDADETEDDESDSEDL